MFFNIFDKNKKQTFLSIDMGSAAVKAMLFERAKNGDINIIRAATAYYDLYSVFNSTDFQADVIKKAILQLSRELKITSFHGEIDKTFLLLPPQFLKEEISWHKITRDQAKPISAQQEKEIISGVLEQAKKDILTNLVAAENEFKFLSFYINEIKADGYKVERLVGCNAREIEFNVLCVYVPYEYLQQAKSYFNGFDWKSFQLVSQSELVWHFFKENNTDAAFLDMGADISRLFVVKNKILSNILEFSFGGDNFIKKISDYLGVREQEAMIIAQRYQINDLSQDFVNKINQRLIPLLESTTLAMQSEISKRSIAIPQVFVSGGGSYLFSAMDKVNPKRIFNFNNLGSTTALWNHVFCPKVALEDRQMANNLLIAFYANKKSL